MNTAHENSTAPPLPLRALIVLVLSQLAAWLAAGSLGWIAPALQKSLTWLAFAAIGIAAVPGSRRLSSREVLILAGAALLAVLMTASSLPVANICAVAVLLAGVAQVRPGTLAQVTAPAALAATALAVFRLLVDSSAAVWTFTNSVGHIEGLWAAWLTGRPLLIGASFGGLDFLVLMAALTAAWLFATPRRRIVRGAWALLFIILAQIAYLLALAFSDDLAALLPPQVMPKNSDISHLGIWTWGNAIRTLLPWNLPLLAALLQCIVAAGMFRLTVWPITPHDMPSEVDETSAAAEGKRRSRSIQGSSAAPSDGPISPSLWRQFTPAGLLIVAAVAITFSPVTPDLKERRIVAYDDGTIDWSVTDPGTIPSGRLPSYGLLPVLVESLGGKFIPSSDLADAALQAADVLVILPTKAPIPDDIQLKISRYVAAGGRMIVAGEPETNLGIHENVLNPLLESTAMSFRDDTANSLTERWEDNLQSAPHAATASSSPGRNHFSFDRAASIRVSWPAGPLVVGRWGWDEVGTDPDRPGALSFTPGNHLGDMTLAAQQNVGQGTVVVLGSSAALSNDGIPFSYTFTGPLLSALAANRPTPLARWRQLVALAAAIAAIVLLFRQFKSSQEDRETYPMGLAAVTAALSLTILACNVLSNATAGLLPSGTKTAPVPVIYVDGSHLEGVGKDPWGEDGIGRFMRVLASNGYLPLVAPDLSAERLNQAAMLISIAPGKAFSSGEIASVEEFVKQGGFFLSMVGSPEVEPSRLLLDKFKLQVMPIPVPPWINGREVAPVGCSGYPSDDQASDAESYAAWPVFSTMGGELWPTAESGKTPIIAGNRIENGQAFVIGDSGFALQKNFGLASPNRKFWRLQLKNWLGYEAANPLPSNPLPLEPNTSGIINLPKPITDKGATPVIRPWIGIALLGISWLLGLNYYEVPNPWAQAVVLILAGWMLTAGERANPLRATRDAYPELTVAILLLLLPVIWWTPWSYRLPPLAIIGGLLLERLPHARRLLRPISAACITGGVVLLAQAVLLTLYAAATARSHDLPAVLVKLMAGLCWLAGIDAAGDGPILVVPSMQQSYRLAISWDMVFDPATLMFLAGGLAWITIDAGRLHSIRLRWAAWGGAMARFALIVAAWLPIRAVVLLALYLHRAAVSEWTEPLHVMNQYLSPWVLLGMLVPPILLAWRWVPLLGDAPLPAATEKEDARPTVRPKPLAPVFQLDNSGTLSVNYLAAAACCLFGSILLAVGLQWEPIGARKAGRVMFVERHSPWSPSNGAYNSEFVGGGDDEHGSSYNYAVAYQYLSQYYQMSRLNAEDAIDEQKLSTCDVLVIKIPRVRYTQEEADAVVKFVEAGGGLLLIGDHTNLERSAANMNDITRAFGFTFRSDVLYSNQPAPDEELYQAPIVPHPAIEHVPEFDFAVSCSIDPGISQGRPVVAAAGLWSMPGDYHMSNFMPYAQHVPETRFGSFIQAWSTHGGRGRVVAWGDSTIFSNFCIYQPNKAKVLLNLVEWLNHQGGAGVWWLWTLLGLGAIVNGLWLVRRDGSAWLVLVAATSCGWIVGSTATAAVLDRAMPLPVPQADRRLPQVVIDRTISQVPLAKGAFNEDRESGRGFGLLEQWIPRLGYQTVRAMGDDVFQGDAVLIVSPSRPATEAYRRRLVEYVAGGGRVLVLDAGASDVPSTSNQILRPFGLSLDYTQPWNGELVKPVMKAEAGSYRAASVEEAKYPPGIYVDSAWRLTGGTSIASVHGGLEKLDPQQTETYADQTICAVAQYGNGLVMVASCGNMFNDKNLGNDWGHNPDPAQRGRIALLFALLRRLVKDEPVVVPTRMTGSTEPKIHIPLNRPGRRAAPTPRRNGGA